MYAPDFIFSIVAASIAEKYLTTSFQLETVTVKHFGRLSEEYSSENHESLQKSAENFLYTLADAGIDTADTYLQNYQFEKFKFNFCATLENDVLDEKTNTVFVATRHDSHGAYVLKALEQNKIEGCLLSSNPKEKISRNEKCPATGKKFKQCCGSLV